MARKFDAVLFDFGGVLTHSPFQAVALAGEEMGAQPGQIEAIIFGPVHEDTDHTWHRLERGEIGLAAARQALMDEARRHGFEIDPLVVLARMAAGRDGGVRPALVERALRIRREGLQTALVTNNVAELSVAWRSMVPVDELFDVVIDSSAVGVRKPDPAIFRLALEALDGVAPGRAVFLDDLEENVRAAERLGLHGVLVGEDDDAVIAALDRLLAA
ncbi:MAG: HAD family hydrolase [Myxococcota bacterium]